jgi:hypothetical protein
MFYFDDEPRNEGGGLALAHGQGIRQNHKINAREPVAEAPRCKLPSLTQECPWYQMARNSVGAFYRPTMQRKKEAL